MNGEELVCHDNRFFTTSSAARHRRSRWPGRAQAPDTRARAAKELVVGFIYVGPKDDYGYNQAHAEAAAMLKKMPGVKIVEEEKVPETDDVSKTMQSMIKLDGATLLFPHELRLFRPVHA